MHFSIYFLNHTMLLYVKFSFEISPKTERLKIILFLLNVRDFFKYMFLYIYGNRNFLFDLNKTRIYKNKRIWNYLKSLIFRLLRHLNLAYFIDVFFNPSFIISLIFFSFLTFLLCGFTVKMFNCVRVCVSSLVDSVC